MIQHNISRTVANYIFKRYKLLFTIWKQILAIYLALTLEKCCSLELLLPTNAGEITLDITVDERIETNQKQTGFK